MAKKEIEKTEVKKEVKKDNKKNVHEVVIKIDGEAWTKALDTAFKKKQKTAKVDGFRKGKVPRDIYEKHFGKESLFIDAADTVLQDAYTKAMEESKLIPVVQPAVDLKSLSEDGVEFTFKIITKPEVKVKKYKGLNIKPEKVEVSEEEINHELGHLLEKYTELVTKEEGTVEEGNTAVIDFEGFKDGVAFDGGKGENYSLEIGSHTFIPGFEEQVIGMKAGEEKDIEVTFPEDYGAKDLAGAKAVFKVKVHEIKEKQNRELDEDFFEDLGIEGVKKYLELVNKYNDRNAKIFLELEFYKNVNMIGKGLIDEYEKENMLDYLEENMSLNKNEILSMFENIDKNMFMLKRLNTYLNNTLTF